MKNQDLLRTLRNIGGCNEVVIRGLDGAESSIKEVQVSGPKIIIKAEPDNYYRESTTKTTGVTGERKRVKSDTGD